MQGTRITTLPLSASPWHSKEAWGREVQGTCRSSLASSCFNACTSATSLPGERQGRIIRTEEFSEPIQLALLDTHHANA
jgi:hypothetical protein